MLRAILIAQLLPAKVLLRPLLNIAPRLTEPEWALRAESTEVSGGGPHRWTAALRPTVHMITRSVRLPMEKAARGWWQAVTLQGSGSGAELTATSVARTHPDVLHRKRRERKKLSVLVVHGLVAGIACAVPFAGAGAGCGVAPGPANEAAPGGAYLAGAAEGSLRASTPLVLASASSQGLNGICSKHTTNTSPGLNRRNCWRGGGSGRPPRHTTRDLGGHRCAKRLERWWTLMTPVLQALHSTPRKIGLMSRTYGNRPGPASVSLISRAVAIRAASIRKP